MEEESGESYQIIYISIDFELNNLLSLLQLNGKDLDDYFDIHNNTLRNNILYESNEGYISDMNDYIYSFYILNSK